MIGPTLNLGTDISKYRTLLVERYELLLVPTIIESELRSLYSLVVTNWQKEFGPGSELIPKHLRNIDKFEHEKNAKGIVEILQENESSIKGELLQSEINPVTILAVEFIYANATKDHSNFKKIFWEAFSLMTTTGLRLKSFQSDIQNIISGTAEDPTFVLKILNASFKPEWPSYTFKTFFLYRLRQTEAVDVVPFLNESLVKYGREFLKWLEADIYDFSVGLSHAPKIRVFDWIENKLWDDEKNDDRIEGQLSIREIKAYWMQLTDYSSPINEKRRRVLTTRQVEHILHANFKGFNPRQLKIERFDTGKAISKPELKMFVREFYDKNSPKAKTRPYCKILVDHFDLYANTTLDSAVASFSKVPRRWNK